MPAELPRMQNFIDRQFIEPLSGRYLDNIEPAIGKPYSQVAMRATAAIIAAKKLNALTRAQRVSTRFTTSDRSR